MLWVATLTASGEDGVEARTKVEDGARDEVLPEGRALIAKVVVIILLES